MSLGFGNQVGAATVRLEVDRRGFDKDWKRAERDVDHGARRMSGALKLAGAAAVGGGLAIAVGLKKGITAASDLEESINKAARTFGKSNRSIQHEAKSSARDLGLSRQAYLENAASIGAMLKPLGIAPDKAAGMSKSMVRLAADMASFNNEDPTEMLDRIRSGISGESEPLKRFGSVLSETRVKQFAWKQGIAETGVELTEQQKIQARYGLLLKDTADQQGDFARTSGGMANQQRIVKAELMDLAAQIGGAFLPVVTRALQLVTGFLPRLREWASAFVDRVRPAIEAVTRAIQGHMPQIRAVFEAVIGVIRNVANYLVEHFGPIFRQVMEIVGRTVANLAVVFEKHRPDLERIWARLKVLIGTTAKVIEAVLKNVVIPILRIAFEEVLPRVLGITIDIIDKLSGWWVKLQNTVIRVVTTILTGVDKFLGGLQALFEGASHIPGIGDQFKGIAEKIGGARQHVRDLRDELGRLTRKAYPVRVEAKVSFQYHGPTGGHVAEGDGGLGVALRAGAQAGVGNFVGKAGIVARPDVTPQLWDELGMARSFGLGVTSTYRGGAVTSTGNRSLHSTYPAQAFDVAGSPAAMGAFFDAVVGRPGLDEVIYSPRGWWHPGSGVTPIPAGAGTVRRDHFSHVHVGDRIGDGIVGSRTGRFGDGTVAVSALRPHWKPGQFGLSRRRGESRQKFLGRLHQLDVASVPARLELLRARAALTPRIEDDVDAQRRIVRWFRHGRGAGWLSRRQEIAVLQALRSEADQLADLQEESGTGEVSEGKSAIATLAALREIFSNYGSNIASGPGAGSMLTAAGIGLGSSTVPQTGLAGGGTVTVIQNFNKPPEDPHPLFASADFAARSTFG